MQDDCALDGHMPLSLVSAFDQSVKQAPQQVVAYTAAALADLDISDLDLVERAALASSIAYRADLPTALLLGLARDKIVVAQPILRYSPMLSDADLAQLVEETTAEHHLAIAGRNGLSPSVTAMLVEMSDADVLAVLLRNHRAMFTEYVFRRLVAAARHADPLRAPVLARRELTPEMALDLSRWVGPDLRRRIAERFGPEAVSAQVEPLPRPGPLSRQIPLTSAVPVISGEPPVNWMPVIDSRATPSATQPPTAAATVPAADAPTGDVLITEGPARSRAHPLVDALRRNDRRRLEAALAELSGLPRFTIQRVVTDPGAEALAVICRGLALKRQLFAAIYAGFHQGQLPTGGAVTDPFRGAIAYFNRLRLPQAASILQGWRRAPITVWQSSNVWTSQIWRDPDDPGDQAASVAAR